MNPQAAWANVSSVAEVIRALTWLDTSAYMYLEHVPQTWLDASARQNGVQLQHYGAGTCFDDWQRGRIFDAQQELKWEQQGGQFHAVYCGVQPPVGWTVVSLHAERQQEQRYYLWGTPVKDIDRERLGVPPDVPAFVELQIPRILQYPVATPQERVQVRICEWYTADGQLCYARWCGLA